MYMLRKNLILFYITITTLLYSQNEIDALRYSVFDNFNTAGISALGGAGGLWSHNHNPASLGFFNGNNLLSISLGNQSQQTESNYFGQKEIIENKINIIPFIQNAGYVTSLQFSENDEWSSINIALSVNRKKNFNKNINISGYNTESSMVNQFVQYAQNISPEELGWNEWLAYDSFLIDPDESEITNPDGTTSIVLNGYQPTSGMEIIGQTQTRKIKETGFINEVDLAFSSAYKDFLFIGGSIGITHMKFSHRSSYKEDEFNDNNNLLNFEYNEYLNQEGGGVNLKIGTIIKPLSFLRVGLAYHSPTYNEISEFYEASIETNFIEPPIEDTTATNFSQNYSSDYDFILNTPSKSILSLAFLKKYMSIQTLLTLDFERVNYENSQLSSIDFYGYDFYDENEKISEYYGATNNIKIGLFLRIKNISLRGGYAIFGSPFKRDEDNEWSQEYMSLGLGYKVNAYSFDLALAQQSNDEDIILYQDFNSSYSAPINNKINTIILTCSYKF